MKVKFFSQENCPKCPAAKAVIEELRAQGLPVEYYDVKTIDGRAEAIYYGLMSTPSTVVTNNSDVELYSWRGEVPEKKKILELWEQEKRTALVPEAQREPRTEVCRVTKIRKRDGRIVPFDKEKITEAIWKAAQSVGGKDRTLSAALANEVFKVVNAKFDDSRIPGVEDVQDIVEKVLIENGHAKTAKSYILYRQKRAILREIKAELLNAPVDEVDSNLSVNAIKVLERRYLLKDRNGRVIETPKQMFRRIAHHVAMADRFYEKQASQWEKTEEEFYNAMVNLEFMPNSPCIMNAGTSLGQLAACFVLPVEDSIEGIFDAVKHAAIIHQTGGGTGFSFSRLRPKGDVVKSTGGIASGPVSFMKVFDAATNTIKQGGRRRGANMGILRVDHPDILEFITMKADMRTLTNFNISVALTERFMDAVEKGEEYELINPRTGEAVRKLNARMVFDIITQNAWKNGDPGIIFLDRVNNSRSGPTPRVGIVEATNPCGEQPLLPYESCNLGSINLAKCLTPDGKRIDWDKLRRLVHLAIHFLDNVIDMNKYPLPQIEAMTKRNRRIGLGVMGWADMLFSLGIPYDSEEAVALAEKVARFIDDESKAASAALAELRGPFANFKGSIWDVPGQRPLRNATTTTIAPTGTISIIAGCSGGIEPLFAIVFIRNVMDNTELLEVHPIFERVAKERGFYSLELMRKIARTGSVQGLAEVPEDVRRVFVTANEITPYWHMRHQAAWQKYIDNAVSKTINFHTGATPEDVRETYLLAYKFGCKGVTIYRDGSREGQPMQFSKEKYELEKQGAVALQARERSKLPIDLSALEPPPTKSFRYVLPHVLAPDRVPMTAYIQPHALDVPDELQGQPQPDRPKPISLPKAPSTELAPSSEPVPTLISIPAVPRASGTPIDFAAPAIARDGGTLIKQEIISADQVQIVKTVPVEEKEGDEGLKVDGDFTGDCTKCSI